MGEASDLPPEGIHLLRLDDIPPDLKRWFEPLANPQQAQDGSYASMAKKALSRPSLMLTVTTRKEKQSGLDTANFDKEVRWSEAPPSAEIAKLFKLDPKTISSVQLDKDGKKLRIFLTTTIAPENTNIKVEGWDYRIFPTAINGFDNIAFVQQHEFCPVAEGEAEEMMMKMFCNHYFKNPSEQLHLKKGTMWRRTPKGYKNVKGTWITATDKLIKNMVSEHIHLCTKGYPLPLTRLFTPWQEKVKQKQKKAGTVADPAAVVNGDSDSPAVADPAAVVNGDNPSATPRQKRNRDDRTKTPENGASPSDQQGQTNKRRYSNPQDPAIASSSNSKGNNAVQPATPKSPAITRNGTSQGTPTTGITGWLANQTPSSGKNGRKRSSSAQGQGLPKYAPNQLKFTPNIPPPPSSETGADQQPPGEVDGGSTGSQSDDE